VELHYLGWIVVLIGGGLLGFIVAAMVRYWFTRDRGIY
jgi:hypothetical protein